MMAHVDRPSTTIIGVLSVGMPSSGNEYGCNVADIFSTSKPGHMVDSFSHSAMLSSFSIFTVAIGTLPSIIYVMLVIW